MKPGQQTGRFVFAYDVGTTGCKASLYRLDTQLTLVGSALEEYPLQMCPGGGVEQDADDWWRAICRATRTALTKAQVAAERVEGLAFCAQMQGLVVVGRDGQVLRPPMSYMDSRAGQQIAQHFYAGLIKIGKWNARKLLRWLQVTGAAAASVKDPLWKYLWLKANEPEVFSSIHAWLDVKDYLNLRATGVVRMGQDSANATFLYDTRKGRLGWHQGLCRTYGVNPAHLPPVVRATDVVGMLTASAAWDLGLPVGTPVFGGGGDLSMIALGAGAVHPGITHIYLGTSGWVSSTVERRLTDLDGMVGSILGAVPGCYNYISELETAGRCLQWVRDHLALDEIGIYLERHRPDDKLDEYQTLYAYLNKAVSETAPGAGGVLFAPWLHGSRSPFEDPDVRGMFFNIGLGTKKRHMIRAVLEGVAFNLCWMLETVERKAERQEQIRLVGGGAQSEVWAQIVADITGRSVEVVEHAQYAGTNGAALVCAVGLGVAKLDEAAALIRIQKIYEPNPQTQVMYRRAFAVFKKLYLSHRKLYAMMAPASDGFV